MAKIEVYLESYLYAGVVVEMSDDHQVVVKMSDGSLEQLLWLRYEGDKLIARKLDSPPLGENPQRFTDKGEPLSAD